MTRTSRAARVSPPPERGHEQLIAALVPDFGAPQRPAPAPVPTLAALSLPLPHATNTLLVGTARIDRAGRVHERILLRALGWAPGHHLDLDTVHGMIVVTAAPAGKHIVDRRGAVALPAAARRMCGIEPGPPLVLAGRSTRAGARHPPGSDGGTAADRTLLRPDRRPQGPLIADADKDR